MHQHTNIYMPNYVSNTVPVKLCQDTNRFNSKLSRTPVRRRNDKNFEKCINSLFRFPGRGCVEPPLGITLLSSVWSAAKTSKSQKALPFIGVPAMGIIYNYMIFNWFHLNFEARMLRWWGLFAHLLRLHARAPHAPCGSCGTGPPRRKADGGGDSRAGAAVEGCHITFFFSTFHLFWNVLNNRFHFMNSDKISKFYQAKIKRILKIHFRRQNWQRQQNRNKSHLSFLQNMHKVTKPLSLHREQHDGPCCKACHTASFACSHSCMSLGKFRTSCFGFWSV